jgi:hypothetical protein
MFHAFRHLDDTFLAFPALSAGSRHSEPERLRAIEKRDAWRDRLALIINVKLNHERDGR